MSGSVRISRLPLVFAILFCTSILSPCVAFGDEAAIDLIGRGGTFKVVDRDGVREVPESSLAVQDGTRRSYINLDEVPVAGSEADESAKSPEDEGTSDQPRAEDGQASPESGEQAAEPEPEEETPEEKAAREADEQALRAMLQQGGAYFYDENNKPLSYQQVKTMVREGDVENIRAQGLHLSSWKSSLGELKEEGENQSPGSRSTNTGSATGKKSVHEIVEEGTPFRQTVQDDAPFDPKKYSAGVPKDGEISPLAVPEDRRSFREVLDEDEREPFDPKRNYTENY